MQTAQVQFTGLYTVARVYNRTTETGAIGPMWRMGIEKTLGKRGILKSSGDYESAALTD